MLNVFPEIKKNFGFGCMRLPMLSNGEVDIEQCKAMADLFLARGFNYFDTAHVYINGKSETAIREFLARRYPRERYVLTNKLTTHCFNKEEEVLPLFQKQLEACGVEYFDFYLMHAQNADIFAKFKKFRAYEQSFKLKEEGKVRHVGISFHDKADVLDKILSEYPQVEIVQIQLNYADWDDAGVEARKVYEVCVKHNKPAVVMEPVKGGTLVHLPKEAQEIFDALNKKRGTDFSNAAYALRYSATPENVCMTLSGMSDLSQMRENVSVMENFLPLDGEEMAAVDKVCAVFRSQNLIQCTSCRYCIEENKCPKKILIPDMFSLVNSKKRFDSWNQDYYYTNVLTINGHGKASDCVSCRGCERTCPQHLPIISLLKDVAKTFEKSA